MIFANAFDINQRLFDFYDTHFDLGYGHEVINQRVDTLAVGLDGLNKTCRIFMITEGAVKQGVGKALDRCNRGLQLMRYIGDKVFSDLFEFFDVSYIVEHSDKA